MDAVNRGDMAAAQKMVDAAAEEVRKENEKLKEDVQRLRELLKLQRQIYFFGGTVAQGCILCRFLLY